MGVPKLPIVPRAVVVCRFPVAGGGVHCFIPYFSCFVVVFVHHTVQYYLPLAECSHQSLFEVVGHTGRNVGRDVPDDILFDIVGDIEFAQQLVEIKVVDNFHLIKFTICFEDIRQIEYGAGMTTIKQTHQMCVFRQGLDQCGIQFIVHDETHVLIIDWYNCFIMFVRFVTRFVFDFRPMTTVMDKECITGLRSFHHILISGQNIVLGRILMFTIVEQYSNIGRIKLMDLLQICLHVEDIVVTPAQFSLFSTDIIDSNHDRTTCPSRFVWDQIKIHIDVNGMGGGQLRNLFKTFRLQIIAHLVQHLCKGHGFFGSLFVLVQNVKKRTALQDGANEKETGKVEGGRVKGSDVPNPRMYIRVNLTEPNRTEPDRTYLVQAPPARPAGSGN